MYLANGSGKFGAKDTDGGRNAFNSGRGLGGVSRDDLHLSFSLRFSTTADSHTTGNSSEADNLGAFPRVSRESFLSRELTTGAALLARLLLQTGALLIAFRLFTAFAISQGHVTSTRKRYAGIWRSWRGWGWRLNLSDRIHLSRLECFRLLHRGERRDGFLGRGFGRRDGLIGRHNDVRKWG